MKVILEFENVEKLACSISQEIEPEEMEFLEKLAQKKIDNGFYSQDFLSSDYVKQHPEVFVNEVVKDMLAVFFQHNIEGNIFL